MKKYFNYILVLLGICFLQACADDEIVSTKVDTGKVASVTLALDFPEMEMVSPNERAAGDAIDAVNNVWALFYDSNGDILKDDDGNILYINSGDASSYTEKIVEGNQRMKFTKRLPAGDYKIYAVANVIDLTTNYKNEIQTVEGLKAIKFIWNEKNVATNNQMFGFFTPGSTYGIENSIDSAISSNGLSNVAPTDHDAPTIAIAGATSISAKLYRLASKVTVAFDASNLQANTFITIKSIRLGNLPISCALWEENKPAAKSDTVALTSNRDKLIPADLVVTNKGNDASTFTADGALFLYENRQGVNGSYKDQKDKMKDKMPYGAFVEIEGEYNYETTLEGSHGKIIYRYMLGEDLGKVFNNFNVTRNRNYKVTLVFNKSAKENISWRIEYQEEKAINIPSEVHISYRHQSNLKIPFTVTVPSGKTVKSVTAEITSNPWYDKATGGEAKNVRSENDVKKYGFLCWGDQTVSGKDVWSNYKTSSRTLTGSNNQYELNIQTEALGFSTEKAENNDETFTGYNNYSNERIAKIIVKVNYGDGTVLTKEVKIVQEPRIVNPIAVYRDWNEESDFHITLLNAMGNKINSYGPWKVEIKSGSDWILLSKDGSSYSNNAITSGASGGVISFYYKPNGSLTSKDATPRCGVISVRFSNEYVEHQIYVRQGYAPMAIGTETSLWTSYNYKGTDSNGKELFVDASPLEEGAWLKRGSKEGIVATDRNTTGFEVQPGSVYTTKQNSTTWSRVASSYSDISVANYRLPDNSDLQNIIACHPYSGFGVAYDGQARETVAFDEGEQYTNSAMGRRGIVICDKDGKNIFFPIGKAGYGRRHNSYCKGGLHYSNEQYAYSDFNHPSNYMYRPTLIDLYKALGAFYWTSTDQQLTFNYSLANIEKQARSYIANDACYVRLIYTGKEDEPNPEPETITIEIEKDMLCATGKSYNDVGIYTSDDYRDKVGTCSFSDRKNYRYYYLTKSLSITIPKTVKTLYFRANNVYASISVEDLLDNSVDYLMFK